MDRLVTVSRIIDELGPIKGEKTLQKIIYLLQQYGSSLGYRFRWNNFGPISFQLQQDIQEIVTLGLIQVSQEDQVPVYSGISSSQQLSTFWQERLQAVQLSPQTLQVITWLDSMGEQRRDPLFLEVVASLDYIRRHPTRDQQLDPTRCTDKILSTAEQSLHQLQQAPGFSLG